LEKGGGINQEDFFNREKDVREHATSLFVSLLFPNVWKFDVLYRVQFVLQIIAQSEKKKSTRAFIYRRQVSTQSNDIHGTVGPFRSGLACAGGGGCKRAVGAQPEIGAFGEGNCTFCEKELLGR
jgi:hypothetical protein